MLASLRDVSVDCSLKFALSRCDTYGPGVPAPLDVLQHPDCSAATQYGRAPNRGPAVAAGWNDSAAREQQVNKCLGVNKFQKYNQAPIARHDFAACLETKSTVDGGAGTQSDVTLWMDR